ncbi:peptide MFS transporter [Erythrobacter sp. YT30]|uniref:peptide MFS transporter n=1 Tax=Erythrobacter sp. YT30 TaxID=1735012 RepID=UPI00076DEAF6|nr:peptide MFS transporter [Erythrobacter sp. YT30]KWV92315.1 MFS transporter [Erythrobacter sp. YT30]
MTTQALPDGDSAGTILGHPKGLFVLFFAEMWERFSYYGMRALLIFYLTKHWLFSDSESGIIYGAYTALVYITPAVGGYMADKVLGQRKAVAFGAVLLTLGHIFMAFEGEPGAGNTDNPIIYVFWLALALIIVGSGFLKANISVLVGQLYPRTDVRRDGAYTIFYMGINLGAAIGSLMCGYIGETYGWAYGFGLAGIGMLAGLIVFTLGKGLLLGRGEPPKPLGKSTEWSMYAIGFGLVAVCWVLIQYQSVVGFLLGGFGLILVGYVIGIAVIKLPAEDRDRIFAAMFLIVTSIVFWALFEQAGSSLNLFTDRHVDRGGVPASTFQSINAIYIILLAPVFATLWTFLGQRGMDPSTPMKFGLGVVQVGLGFLVLVWGANSVGINVPTPVIFIFLIYLLHTTGELCLSPVGLSAMNRLAPAHMASLIMGTWFFASATGNFAAGLIAAATGAEGVGDASGKQVVLDVYSTVGLYAVVIGVGVMIISPLIKKLMHLDTLKDDEALEGAAEAGFEAQEAGIHPATRPAE